MRRCSLSVVASPLRRQRQCTRQCVPYDRLAPTDRQLLTRLQTKRMARPTGFEPLTPAFGGVYKYSGLMNTLKNRWCAVCTITMTMRNRAKSNSAKLAQFPPFPSLWVYRLVIREGRGILDRTLCCLGYLIAKASEQLHLRTDGSLVPAIVHRIAQTKVLAVHNGLVLDSIQGPASTQNRHSRRIGMEALDFQVKLIGGLTTIVRLRLDSMVDHRLRQQSREISTNPLVQGFTPTMVVCRSNSKIIRLRNDS